MLHVPMLGYRTRAQLKLGMSSAVAPPKTTALPKMPLQRHPALLNKSLRSISDGTRVVGHRRQPQGARESKSLSSIQPSQEPAWEL